MNIFRRAFPPFSIFIIVNGISRSMKTGVIVLVQNCNDYTRPVAEWYAQKLSERGHQDVNVAYHNGEPDILTVLRRMNVHGQQNVFIVLPLLVSEGNLSIWDMPKRMGMPDNSCSYTYITGTHIAIRFSTAFGKSEALSRTLLKRLEEASASTDDGILLVTRGSELGYAMEDAEHHCRYLSKHGFPNTACVAVKHGSPSISEGMKKLKENGAKRVIILPMYIFRSKSVTDAIPSQVSECSIDIPISYAEPLGCEELLLDELDSKIPEGW